MEALKFLLKLLGTSAILTSTKVQQHVYLQRKVICCFKKKKHPFTTAKTEK